MKKEIKSLKSKVLTCSFAIVTLFASCVYKARAAGGCQNSVPNPLNPNCDSGAASTLTVGGITNRFLGAIPMVITVVTVAAIARGAVKIILAPDAEKRQAGFKVIINAALGAAVFYSIWLILFLIEYFTGAELIPF